MIEGSGSVPLTNDPDPGGPKKYGSGSATLAFSFRLSIFFCCSLGSGADAESITAALRLVHSAVLLAVCPGPAELFCLERGLIA
jgi:hypothetical protein